MADRSAIEWCHATINAISGCSLESPGCTNCYAMRAGGQNRPHHPSTGLTQPTKAGHVWTGAVRLNEEWLRRPLTWAKPRRIFWNAHGDPFHPSVPFEWVDRELAVAALTPQHRHILLTKRSSRMRRYFENPHLPERILDAARYLKALPASWQWPLPNLWLGVSVEDQPRADERIPDLLATPAAVRFLSCEPLLGPVDLLKFTDPTGACCGGEPENHCAGCPSDAPWRYSIPSSDGQWAFDPTIDWVIVGGESGAGARPMHPAWSRALRDQCADAGIPFLMKQWGDWAPVSEMDDALIEGIYEPAPERDPEASRRCKVEQCVLHDDGTRFDGRAMYEMGAFLAGTGAMTMFKVGKKRAGRLLYGVLHDAYPELFAHELRQPEAVDA